MPPQRPPRTEYSEQAPNTPEQVRLGKLEPKVPREEPSEVPTLRPAPELDSSPPSRLHQGPLHVPSNQRTLTGVAPQANPPAGYVRRDSPPPVSNPPPASVDASDAERELAVERTRRQDAEAERDRAERLAARGLPWWADGGEIRKILLTLGGLGIFGGGGALVASKKDEPKPPMVDPCTPEALRGVPRERTPTLCTRLEKLESDDTTQNADIVLLKGVFGDLQREVKSVKPIVVKPER